MKLGLGTVQFGLKYGISNKTGVTTTDEAEKIIKIALDNKVEIIDTACQYGSSEEVLGKIIPLDYNFKIITKTPSYTFKRKRPITKDDAKNMQLVFFESLKKLNKQKIYSLMLHHCEDLLQENSDYLYEILYNFKEKFLIKKIGVSVYSPEQVKKLIENYNIDLIQIPLNIFDQRFLENNFLQELKDKNIEIHARSAFLQGLLLMKEKEFNPYFNSIRIHFSEYINFLKELNLSQTEAALGFVLGIENVDVVIVGINNSKQFHELISINDINSFSKFSRFSIKDINIINPSCWRI
ncbi:MAG: aldo/keto reductase [Spirochaetia bacterium]|nr:aldo/keto reductase [Spirochaetia bacterium]